MTTPADIYAVPSPKNLYTRTMVERIYRYVHARGDLVGLGLYEAPMLDVFVAVCAADASTELFQEWLSFVGTRYFDVVPDESRVNTWSHVRVQVISLEKLDGRLVGRVVHQSCSGTGCDECGQRGWFVIELDSRAQKA